MVQLRRAGWHDLLFLRRVRNEPQTRFYAASQGAVGFVSHVRWWLRRSHRGEGIFVVWAANARIGYVRVSQPIDGMASVSIALLPRSRGHGLGKGTIQALLAATRGVPGLKGWEAVVRRDNNPSLGAFRAVGFVERGQEMSSGGNFVILRREIDEMPE